MRLVLRRLLGTRRTSRTSRDASKAHGYLIWERFHSSQARASETRTNQPGIHTATYLLHQKHEYSQATDEEETLFRLNKYDPGLNSGEHALERRLAKRKPEFQSNRLEDFDLFCYESDIEAPATDGKRLVDQEEFVEDWRLWQRLLRFRKRHHGGEGIRSIWRAMLERKLQLPTYGPFADELWDQIIQQGYESREFLAHVVSHAIDLQENTGKSWPKLYIAVMSIIIKTDPAPALLWHRKMVVPFPPTRGDYELLFEKSIQLRRLSVFRDIYEDILGPNNELPLRLLGIYTLVVPKLCKSHMYTEALEWHNLLVKTRNMPRAISDIEPLLVHYAKIKDGRTIQEICEGIKPKNGENVGIFTMVEKFVRREKLISRELMNLELGQAHGIAPKQISDQFCSRLFATRMFSVGTVINGLQILTVDIIGPLALRELVSRDDCDCTVVSRHLQQLQESGINLDTCRFSRLVRKFAVEGKRDLLSSIITGDLHPDAYENIIVLEDLLTKRYEYRDRLQYQRMLNIITAEIPEQFKEVQRRNLVLRVHIRLRDKAKLLAELERMKTLRVPILPKSSRMLRMLWLSPRQRSKQPVTLGNLFLIINVMKQSLEDGCHVPIEAWREVLKRLGMMGQLAQFQHLAVWLADCYRSPPPSANSGSKDHRLVSVNPSQSQHSHWQEPSQIQTNVLSSSQFDTDEGTTLFMGLGTSQSSEGMPTPQQHLSEIFSVPCQQGIIAWGFQQEAKVPPKHLKGNPGRERAQRHRLWTWGLLLLAKLRDRGVPVRNEDVAKACKQRLIQLFDRTRFSKRVVNRRSRIINSARGVTFEGSRFHAFRDRIQKLWGEDLFKDESRPFLVRRIDSKTGLLAASVSSAKLSR